jgi:IS30 family transposase
MAWHEELTKASGVPVYFAERSSPWQRGADENFNGLARQYFPKGTNLALHSAKHVARVQRELNERPRKKLDYDTPAALRTHRDPCRHYAQGPSLRGPRSATEGEHRRSRSIAE